MRWEWTESGAWPLSVVSEAAARLRWAGRRGRTGAELGRGRAGGGNVGGEEDVMCFSETGGNGGASSA